MLIRHGNPSPIKWPSYKGVEPMGHTHNDHSYYEDYGNFDKWIKKKGTKYIRGRYAEKKKKKKISQARK